MSSPKAAHAAAHATAKERLKDVEGVAAAARQRGSTAQARRVQYIAKHGHDMFFSVNIAT